MKTLRRLCRIAAIGAIGLLSHRSLGQQVPEPAGVIRINVNLVQVDAVVTDSRGNPVTDLVAEDFEVLQDGQPQRITSFEFVRARLADPAAAPALNVAAVPRTGAVPPPPPQAPELRRDEIRRTIALVVDDLALSFDSVVRVREALKKWVDTEMQPGDLAAVIRTSAGMGSLQRFTMDKQMLYTAIDLIRSHFGRVGTSSFAPLSGPLPTDGVLDTSVFDDEVHHAYLVGSLGAIQYVVRGLRDLPGRKSLVLFSEDMRFTFLQGPGLVPSASLTQVTGEERMRRLADEANRSSVVIYAIDPRGVVFTGLTAEDNAGAFGFQAVVEDPEAAAAEAEAAAAEGEQTESVAFRPFPDRTAQLIASRDGMIELTQRTGGLFVRDTNDIPGALRRVVDDGDGYYLLGYQPDASTFDGSGQTQFHTIRVRVKRPGLTVRSRSGFLGNPDNRAAPPEEAQRMQITRALVSPFTTGDIRVRLTGLYFPGEAAGSSIKVLIHMNPQDLTLTEDPDGSRKAEVDIAAVAFDADGEPLTPLGLTSNLRIPDENFSDVMRHGIVYSTELPVEKPGGYQVRVAIRDKTSLQVGSAMQFVEVPDAGKGRLLVSGILLGEQQTEQREASTAAQAAAGSPALRVFRSGSALTYAYEILNVRTDGDKKTQLDAQMRLFRDGRMVYEGPQTRLNEDQPLANPKQLVAAGSFRLSEIPPGRYVLQIVVTDQNRYDKYRIAANAIDFEVTETPRPVF